MWDDIDWSEIFGGGTPDFTELPLGMGPDVNLQDVPDSYWGDPYADWGGGAGGDGSDGSSDMGGSGLPAWLKALMPGGKGGKGFDLASLLIPALLGGGGLYLGNKATNKATDELKQGAKDANALAEKLIGGAQANFAPFIGTGTKANADLYALTQQPGLAGKFGPIAAKQLKPIRGSVTLAELSQR